MDVDYERRLHISLRGVSPGPQPRIHTAKVVLEL